MKHYDVIVVGGGIAGLYASLRCCEKGMSVCTIEQDDRWGGRIRTIHKDNEIYEAGAARFHKSHKHLLRIVKRYNIETVSLDDRKREYRDAHCSPSSGGVVSPAYKLIQKIVEGAKGKPASLLRTMTFGEFAETVIGSSQRGIAQSAFGYDGEFDIINAYDGVRMFKHDFSSSEAFYVCKNGLGSIVDAMVAELEQSKGWKGLTGHRVGKITDENGTKTVIVMGSDGKETILRSRLVVLALPKKALLELGMWSPEQVGALESVQGVPCTRIYAKYKNPWFSGMPITTTDLPIRQFIPINDKLAMVSYSDSKQADSWNTTAEQGTGRLGRRVCNGLKELFPEKKVPLKPSWIEAYHWENAIHMWRPNTSSDRVRRGMVSGDWGVFICGEAYSRHQCWIEGALEMVDEMMENISRMKGGNDDDWKKWVRSKKRLKKEDLKELRRLYPDAKWVLFQDRLIDLTQWYYAHPGGRTPFDDHMYKDVYPFFKKISHHYDNNEIKNNVFHKIEQLTLARLV